MLTETQQRQMKELADSFPCIARQLADKGYVVPERVDLIPTQLMRLYISTL